MITIIWILIPITFLYMTFGTILFTIDDLKKEGIPGFGEYLAGVLTLPLLFFKKLVTK